MLATTCGRADSAEEALQEARAQIDRIREITKAASGPQKPHVYAGALARIAALVHTEETWLPADCRIQPAADQIDEYGFSELARQLLDSLIAGHHWNGKQEEAHAILADFTRLTTAVPAQEPKAIARRIRDRIRPLLASDAHDADLALRLITDELTRPQSEVPSVG